SESEKGLAGNTTIPWELAGTTHHDAGGEGDKHQPAGLVFQRGRLHRDQAANLSLASRAKGSLVFCHRLMISKVFSSLIGSLHNQNHRLNPTRKQLYFGASTEGSPVSQTRASSLTVCQGWGAERKNNENLRFYFFANVNYKQDETR
ncbi:hypothetical protein HGM15179_004168, partial [Zosterops borbonicus]